MKVRKPATKKKPARPPKKPAKPTKPPKDSEKQRPSNDRYRGLKPWKKGQSGNPKGRAKKDMVISDAAREILAGTGIELTITTTDFFGLEKTKTLKVTADKNLAYGIAAIAIEEALKGNMKAFKEIADRVQGKPHQSIGIGPAPAEEEQLPDDLLAEIYDRVQGGK
jgi:hypothetical protein